MPTNDERRQVAARLREQKVWDMFTNFEDCIGGLCDAVFEDEGDTNDMFRLQKALADLIEPEERTCRMEFSERKRGVYCSHCGERMDIYTCDQYGDGTMGYSYPFCCECGAKVVSE